jgi:tRNA (cytidine/uridine-2'-O-)-methyltransferase
MPPWTAICQRASGSSSVAHGREELGGQRRETHHRFAECDEIHAQSYGRLMVVTSAYRSFRQPLGPKRPLSLHVVLVHPEIHWNTGNAGRTCLAAGATLHLVEPLGFSLDDREVKRAGLDYWEFVDLRVWRSWDTFEAALSKLGDPYFFSTKATQLLWDAPLGETENVVLVFGGETGGLPAELHDRYRNRFVMMPILSPHVRSLNLSTSVAIAVYEVLRQRRARPRN